MARKKAPPADRSALLLRMSPELKDEVTAAALDEGITVNDYVLEVLQNAVREKAIDRDLRDVGSAAIQLAAPALKALESKSAQTLERDARLTAIEAMLCVTVAEAVRRMLQPPKTMMFIASLWAMILQDAEKLGLKGPIWDYIRALGPDSPPPTQEHVNHLSDEITRLKDAGLRGEKMKAVESLNVWLGLAVHQHEETWQELLALREEQRTAAKSELYSLLSEKQTRKKSRK